MNKRHLAFGAISFVIFTALFLMADIGRAEIRPRIRIDTIPSAQPGTTVTVPIYIQNYPLQMGGFDFIVAYDKAAMTITDATLGQLPTACGWELFAHQVKDSAGCQPDCSGRMRIVAIAETANGPYHPSCYGPADSAAAELAVIYVQIADTAAVGVFKPIRFFWNECTDNALSSVSGDFLFIDSRIYDDAGSLLWDEADTVNFPEASRPLFVGTPDSCVETTKAQFVCGDVNGDGKITIGDAVFIISYLFRSGSAPYPIEMGDVNGDGAFNITDAVYLVAYIFRGGPAPICDGILRIIEFQHGGIGIQ
ncbi:MAG: dockerin type I domain-containing protein [candidate division Zixibacteria bacterium]|nr:dockerin type I domain-containing protein [candidate division Zixibacteria bacterium]